MKDIALHRLLAWNGPLITLLGLALALAAGLLLVRLTPLGGVLFVGLAVVGVAAVIEPLVGLAAALFLGLLWAYLRAEVPQVPAQIAQVFVALTLAAWLARGLVRREIRIPHPLGGQGNRKGLPLLLPLLIFLGAALLSLWDAVELPVYGVPEFIKWVQILLLFIFVSDHLTPRRLPWLLGALLVTGLFQAGVGIWQFGLRGEGPEHFAILGDRFYRAYGTFEQPNPYAGYLGLMLPLAVGPLAIMVRGKLVNWYTGKLVRGRPSSQSTNLPTYQSTNLLVYQFTIPSACPTLLVGGVSTIAMLAALAMSWSRGAWLGFGAAVLVMAVALPRKTRWGLLLVAVLVVGVFSLYTAGLLPDPIVARLTDFAQDVRFEDVRGVGINDANYAVIERLAHWQVALEMIRYNLWTGVGFGCYEPAYPRFALINWPIALGHAHNYYLNVAAETGIIGLAAYLLLWVAVFWQTWQVTRRAHGLLRGVAIGLLGTWTHLSIHHFLDNLYVNNVHLYIGVLLGLLAWLARPCPTARSRL
ncbi:MAG TPA: O-antigen ligase family protein [Thermoflexia bacterium]|nr:O-antigen ligase family protein [Thermoflexia bacterium]